MDDRIIMYLNDGSIMLVQGERQQPIARGATNHEVDAEAAAFFTDSSDGDAAA